MQELRQSTAINLKIGTVVSSTGVTPVTTLAITTADQAEFLKNGTSATLAISGTLSAITNCDGWYNLSATTGDTSALGPFTVVIQDSSLCLPVFRDYMIVDQPFYDAKYNSTGALRCNIIQIGGSATIALSDFHASVSGYSTFTPASDAVSLGSATYTTATSFHASVTGYSTFTPASDAVSLGSAVYLSINDFKATGFSTFDSTSDGVSLGSATYTTATAFHASVASYSTFDPSASGVSLGSATYTTATAFHASVAAYSTFDPSSSGVSLGSAVYTAITDFRATGGDATSAKQDIITTHLTDVKGGTWASGTDSLEAIRNRGDAAWVTGGGASGSNAITINVEDQVAADIIEAAVEVWTNDGASLVTRDNSDSSGEMSTNLDDGNYLIKIHKAGYLFVNTTMTVSGAGSNDYTGTALTPSAPGNAGECQVYEWLQGQGVGSYPNGISSTAKIINLPYDSGSNIHLGDVVNGTYVTATGYLSWDIVQGAEAEFIIGNFGTYKKGTVPATTSARLTDI